MTAISGAAVITPSAARLTESLRDIGYDFPAAVADIVDNSIAAGASRVDVTIGFDGEEPRVAIADNGEGMMPAGLLEALRFGSCRAYGRGELGRYGLGLKTAALSQCRSVTVATRPRATRGGGVTVLAMDLDLIAERDEWLAVELSCDRVTDWARERLAAGPGTVVIWRKLDRVLPEQRPDGGWARRRLDGLAGRTAAHLGAVFHRYLEAGAGRGLAVTVNGQRVSPWNPFAPGEPTRGELPLLRFEISTGEASGTVTFRRFVLPARSEFSSPEEFGRYSGPLGWNRQQGIYVYRAGRLVQWGGWNRLRGIDEHTKLARAALDFGTDLDAAFNINVAKMRVTIPPQIRPLLERAVGELCACAGDRYRRAPWRPGESRPAALAARRGPGPALGSAVPAGAGLALRAAAMQAGEYEAFRRITAVLSSQAPEIAGALGLDM